MKKQILISSLSLAVIFALSACGSSEEPRRERPPMPPRDQRLRPPAPGGGGGPGGGGPGPQGIPIQGGPQGGPQGQPGQPGPQQQGGRNSVPGPSRKQPARGNVAQDQDQNQDQDQDQAQEQSQTPSRAKPKGKRSAAHPRAEQESVPHSPSLADKSTSSTEDATADAEVPNFTSKSYKADLANLARSEAALAGVGLKVLPEYNAQKHLTGINWDSAFMDAYKGSVRADAPQALESYRQVAERFMKRYGQPFQIEGSDDAYATLSGEPLRLIKGTLDLTSSYIVKLAE